MKAIRSFLSIVAGLGLFVMMWVTLVDVIGRKFFDSSLVGAVELTEFMMMITIFFAMPLTSLAGEHIVFDLFDRHLPDGVTRIQRRVANLITAAIMFGGAWIVFERAQRTLEFGDITAQLETPIAPFHFMMSGSLVVVALVHIALAFTRDGSAAHAHA
ncbi:MAG: TRAP transporter small permease [Burkholderiaceae bacterium]